MMVELLAIGLGGAVGALCRYGVTLWASSLVCINFPYSTLIINVLGSFAVGLVFILLVERNLLAPIWRSVLMVGFLGAFTTFSTFSLQALGLMEEGRYMGALGYIASSVITCILATALGMYLARQMS